MTTERVLSTQHIKDSRSEKQRLIDELHSQIREVAMEAAVRLRQHKWLLDGSLQEAYLLMANLQEADLHEANLSGATLWMANLRGADLAGANLKRAFLLDADLENANLEGAFLDGAVLGGANLAGAKLRGARLSRVGLDKAILPDRSAWTPGTDMARFTDPTCAGFWSPGNAAPVTHELE